MCNNYIIQRVIAFPQSGFIQNVQADAELSLIMM